MYKMMLKCTAAIMLTGLTPCVLAKGITKDTAKSAQVVTVDKKMQLKSTKNTSSLVTVQQIDSTKTTSSTAMLAKADAKKDKADRKKKMSRRHDAHSKKKPRFIRKKRSRKMTRPDKYQNIIKRGQVNTLQDAFEVGYATNPKIMIAFFKMKSAKAKGMGSYGALLPRIEGSMNSGRKASNATQGLGGDTRTDGKFPPLKSPWKSEKDRKLDWGDRNDTYSLKAQWDAFTFGSTVDQIIEARSGFKAARYSFLKEENEALSKIAELYFDCYYNKKAVSIREKALEFAQKLLKSIKMQVNLGEKTVVDLAQARAKLAQATAILAQAMHQHEKAKADFYSAVGINIGDSLTLSPNSYQAYIPQTYSAFVTQAKAMNPSVKSAAFASKARRAVFRRSLKGHLPKLTFGASYDQSYARKYKTENDKNERDIEKDTRSQAFSWNASINVPIFSGGAQLHETRAARFDAKGAKMELINIHKQVESHCKNLWEGLKAIRLQREAREKQVEFAKKSMIGMREALNSGLKTVVDVLESETKYRDAQIELNKISKQEQMIVFQILSLLGTLNHNTLGLSTLHR